MELRDDGEEDHPDSLLETSLEAAAAAASGPLDLTQDLESLLSLTQFPAEEDGEQMTDFPPTTGRGDRMSQYTEQAQQWEMGGMIQSQESILSAELLLQESEAFWS